MADALAARSERVAAALDAGADCDALAQTRSLEGAVSRAIARGAVPPALREELRGAVARLAGEIDCAPAAEPAPPAEPAQDESPNRPDEKKPKEHGEKGKHGKEHE